MAFVGVRFCCGGSVDIQVLHKYDKRTIIKYLTMKSIPHKMLYLFSNCGKLAQPIKLIHRLNPFIFYIHIFTYSVTQTLLQSVSRNVQYLPLSFNQVYNMYNIYLCYLSTCMHLPLILNHVHSMYNTYLCYLTTCTACTVITFVT